MKEATAHSRPQSKILPGPADLRHYPAHHLVAWQPRGVLDDRLLDDIAEWLVAIEKVSLPFKRYIDLSQLTNISLRTRHVLDFARKRAEQFRGTKPVQSAVFSDDWVGYGIATLYESLMANTLIKVRAFRDRLGAAEWLEVPAAILNLDDRPAERP